jgi:hypothetical protein
MRIVDLNNIKKELDRKSHDLQELILHENLTDYERMMVGFAEVALEKAYEYYHRTVDNNRETMQ